MERIHRKLILLHHKLSKLCEQSSKIGGRQVEILGNKYVIKLNAHENSPYEISKKVLEGNIRGSVPEEATAKLYDRFVTRLFRKDFNFVRDPISDANKRLSVFEFGNCIGFSRAQSRFILDHSFAAVFPSFSTFSVGNATTRKFAEAHGGVYYLYRLDRNEALRKQGFPLGVVSRADVIVRYPVPYKGLSLTGGKSFRIRCKMNIPEYPDPNEYPVPKGYPNLTEDPDFFKYDGFVSKKGSTWWQWLFQSRQGEKRNSEDLILMYSQQKPVRKHINDHGLEIRRGKMLYQRQTNNMEPVASEIILTRVPGHRVVQVDAPNEEISSILKESSGRYFETSPPEREAARSPKLFDLHRSRDLDKIDDISIKALLEKIFERDL